ncbi:hypothetical protein BLNAU_18408 [Blattamonas nauphoetae]|uniref:Myb-like domain-containing protein n=1 Tax=Blattamonas nauphoetae TaxID=2049346 RepID=A0ABQ9X4F1_9EUKA|nr:hypothetical protein BLNAU_18408 [Blattamonas nauphoetae]
MLIDPPPPEPRTPPPERSLLLQALLTPSRATPKRSKTAEKAEERLRSEMSGALHPGIITYSMDEPQETGQDQTQSPGILNDSVTSSPYVCALFKIERWRAGRPVSFSEEEMSRYLAFVEEIPEIVTKEKAHKTVKKISDKHQEPRKKQTKKKKRTRRETSDDSTDSELLEESIHKVKRLHSHHSADDDDESWSDTEKPKRSNKKRNLQPETPPVVVENEEGRKDSTDSTALEEAIIQQWKASDLKTTNQGPTRLHTFLTKVSIDQLKNPQAHAVPFSPETQENHRWIYRMLKDFGDASNLDSVLPLQETVVREFIYALGINDLVCIPALDSTIRCGLVALDTLHRGERTPDNIRIAIAQTISLVKEEKESPDFSIGKPPLLATDLHKILSHIPDCIPEKPFECSLFLFSLCTGARASTCAAVALKDIERIVCLRDSSVLLITLRLRKMKGHHAQDTVVTLEGDVFASSCLNVVYWLQQHLLQRFGLSLTRRDEWDQTCSLDEKIWLLGPDAMTIRLQNRAFQAGFDRQYFGFHSLRSGFISSALIKAGDDNQARTRVLEQTAIVARWVPYSTVQMKYIKSSMISTHVANRLVLPDSELHASNVIEPILATTELFHNTKLQPISWTGGEQLLAFKEQVSTVLGMACALSGTGSIKFQALKTKATKVFCQDQSISKTDLDRYIQNCLLSGRTPVSMAQQYLRSVREDLPKQPTVALTAEVVVPVCPPAKPIRKRKYWLEWELHTLADGREAKKSWQEISQMIAAKGGERTPDNCKIRWFAAVRDMRKELQNDVTPPPTQSRTGKKREVRKSGLSKHLQALQEAITKLETESDE